MIRTCVTCNQEFDASEPRPSYARGNVCNECSKPQPTQEQLEQWEDAGNYYVNEKGEEVHYAVGKVIEFTFSED